MDLKSRLQQELKEAMRSRDERRKQTVRMALSAIKLAEVEKGGPLSEGEILNVLRRELKSRKETLEIARESGREDIVQEVQAEIAVLEALLPPPLSDEELDAIIEEAIQKVGATSVRDMGRVMREVMARVQGRAEGGEVSRRVRERLAALG